MWARGRSFLKLHRHASRCSPLVLLTSQPLFLCISPQVTGFISHSRSASTLSWVQGGDWRCHSCGNINFARRKRCNSCNLNREDTDKAVELSKNILNASLPEARVLYEKTVRGKGKIPDLPKFYRQAAEVFGNHNSIEDIKVVLADVRAERPELQRDVLAELVVCLLRNKRLKQALVIMNSMDNAKGSIHKIKLLKIYKAALGIPDAVAQIREAKISFHDEVLLNSAQISQYISKENYVDACNTFISNAANLDIFAATELLNIVRRKFLNPELVNQIINKVSEHKEVFQADVEWYRAVAAYYEASKQFDKVPKLMTEVVERGLRPDVGFMTVVATNYAALGDVDSIFALVEAMKQVNTPPDEMFFTLSLRALVDHSHPYPAKVFALFMSKNNIPVPKTMRDSIEKLLKEMKGHPLVEETFVHLKNGILPMALASMKRIDEEKVKVDPHHLDNIYELASKIPNGLLEIETANFSFNDLPLLHTKLVLRLASMDQIDQAFEAFVQYAPNLTAECPVKFISYLTKDHGIHQEKAQKVIDIVDENKEVFNPDIFWYSKVLYHHSWTGDIEGAQNVLQNVAAAGITPDGGFFSSLAVCYASANLLDPIWEIIETVKNAGLGPNASFFIRVLKKFGVNGNIEGGDKLFGIMKSYQVVIEPETLHGYLASLVVANADGALSTLINFIKDGYVPKSSDIIAIRNAFAEKRNGEKSGEVLSLGIKNGIVLHEYYYDETIQHLLEEDKTDLAVKYFNEFTAVGLVLSYNTFAEILPFLNIPPSWARGDINVLPFSPEQEPPILSSSLPPPPFSFSSASLPNIEQPPLQNFVFSPPPPPENVQFTHTPPLMPPTSDDHFSPSTLFNYESEHQPPTNNNNNYDNNYINQPSPPPMEPLFNPTPSYTEPSKPKKEKKRSTQVTTQDQTQPKNKPKSKTKPKQKTKAKNTPQPASSKNHSKNINTNNNKNEKSREEQRALYAAYQIFREQILKHPPKINIRRTKEQNPVEELGPINKAVTTILGDEEGYKLQVKRISKMKSLRGRSSPSATFFRRMQQQQKKKKASSN